MYCIFNWKAGCFCVVCYFILIFKRLFFGEFHFCVIIFWHGWVFYDRVSFYFLQPLKIFFYTIIFYPTWTSVVVNSDPCNRPFSKMAAANSYFEFAAAILEKGLRRSYIRSPFGAYLGSKRIFQLTVEDHVHQSHNGTEMYYKCNLWEPRLDFDVKAIYWMPVLQNSL